ncbi:unnamed protein product [Laminaria digitata]
MHVDGISVYSLDSKGLVRRHDLETIIVNGTPAKPPFAQAWLHPPSWITKGEAAAVLAAPLGVLGFPTGWRSSPSALDGAEIVAGMVAATTERKPPTRASTREVEGGGEGKAWDSGSKKAPAGKTLTEKKDKKKKKKKGFWPIEYDGPLGCETSWDCTGGYVCCDLLVVRICCSNGVMQRKPGDLIPVLTPIPGRGRTELDQYEPTMLPR